ncbi:uncharacterized protein N7482_010649 [Penicillium canariense]|uniref:Zn(2)-C6 fungal-type domain-containing protein n=1 Tax=Penicillium canariense TaxID=189055 RepID=A0A9W9HL16_9EURO|nr:uncharacterized protein N7482_010649 [Penicillium canariense]KAJ5151397.1 hypothetical protein N7482_010649 [Penicillium canariense]
MRGPGSPPRRKLKESCSQCAYVKVKCSKEKPTCVRCQSRGLRCNYELSHRAGRRPASARILSADRVGTPRPSPPSPPRPARSSSPTSITAASTKPDDGTTTEGSASLPSPLVDQICGLPLPPVHGLSGTGLSPGIDLSPFLLGSLHSPFNSPASEMKAPMGGTTGDIADTLPSSLDFDAYQLWPSIGDLPMQAQLDCLAPSSSSSSISNLCHGTLIGQSSCSRKMLTELAGAQNASNPFIPWADSPGSTGVNDAIALNRYILQVATSVLECSCLQSNHQLRYLLVFTAMDVLARHAAVAASGPADGEDRVAHASLVFGELHRVLQFIDLLFQRCRQQPSFSSARTSPRRSPDPFQHLDFAEMQNPTDPGMVTRGPQSAPDSPHNIDYEVDEDHFPTEADDSLFDLAFLPLETELRRQFEQVRDEIKSILRNV